MFQHLNKAGDKFKDALFEYMADFILKEMVPDNYDYIKLFRLC